MAGQAGFISFQVDSSGPVRKLATWGVIISDLRPAWTQIGEELRNWWFINFVVQGGSIGKGGAWRKLKPSTVADRERQGYFGPAPILYRDGTLMESLTALGATDNVYVPLATMLTIGTANSYAAFHQRGTSRMVARPIVGISKAQGGEIIPPLQQWLNGQAAGVWGRA